MALELGRRERKKHQTRRLIFEVASRLFHERGFDAVTVAEVAREADVSEPTVFNYFATKEDLFFAGMAFFEEEILTAVGERGLGESVITVVARMVVEGTRLLADDERTSAIADAGRLIGGSPALQMREREILAAYSGRLAAQIADETGSSPGDVEPMVVAGALMAAQRALVSYVRSQVLAGRRGKALARSARRQAEQAFGRLEVGLADYGTRPK